MRRPSQRAQSGFTLLEAIVVIVVLGVVATMAAVFIRAPVQAYADSVARAEVTDAADLAVRRIARDLRLALPNSIRVANGGAIEFLLTKAGGRYLSTEEKALEPTPTASQPLDFVNATTSFTVVGPMPSMNRVVPNEFVVVHNLGEGLAPSDAYQFGNTDPNAPRNIARIAAISADRTLVTLDDNPFAGQNPPMPSPTQRFQVVSGPVTYFCGPRPDGTLALWRMWGYAISTAQAVPPARAQQALVATGLASCNIFEYGAPGTPTRRSALVILTLELKARNERDPTIRLVHQIHVDNTP
jgi:MSHA biogenesis protein MshO